MMPSKKQVALVDDILQTIMQSEMLGDMTNNDPCISHDEEILDAILVDLDEAKRNAIKDAVMGVVSSYESVAVLYGMQVVFSMMEVSRNHKPLSKLILERQRRLEG